MATLQELQSALIAADRAGATDDARALASAILSIQQQSKPKPLAEDPGAAQTMLIGAGRTIDRLGKGLKQVWYGATGNQQAQDELAAQAAEDDRVYQPLREARPWSTGIGEAAPSMVIPGGGATTLLGNAGRMAVAGALPGMLEYGDTGDRLKRGIVGATAGAAVPVAGAILKTGKSLLEPLYQGGREAIIARTLNRVAGENAPQIAQRMAQAGELVPGSVPTAAQVAQSGGIAALERAAAATNPEAYTQRAMEQSAARVGALRDIAKDQSALDAATAARDAAARNLYAQSDAATVPIDDSLRALLGRMPSGTVRDAQELRRMAGKPFDLAEGVPAQSVPTGLLDAAGAPVMRNMPAQQAQIGGDALHAIKMALGDRIATAGQTGTGPTAKRAMTGLLDDYLAHVDTAIPAYGQARQAFAEMSRPVNQMKIGQGLLDKLEPALADYGALGKETASKYATAMRNADATAADLVGSKSAKMADVMTPEQMKTLTNIAEDLARKVNAQDIGRGVGSDTVQKLAMTNIAAQSGMPRVVGGLLDAPGVGRATNWVYRDADQKILQQLADVMLDPKRAAQLMTEQQRTWLQNNPNVRRLLEQAAIRPALVAPTAAMQQGQQ